MIANRLQPFCKQQLIHNIILCTYYNINRNDISCNIIIKAPMCYDPSIKTTVYGYLHFAPN